MEKEFRQRLCYFEFNQSEKKVTIGTQKVRSALEITDSVSCLLHRGLDDCSNRVIVSGPQFS